MAAGDPIRILHRDEHEVSVLDITRLEGEGYYDVDILRRALALEALSQGWRDSFLERLARFS
ncbi:MAG TPA: 3-alpha domain-containing protein [Ktedonobacteraceae bacterium]